MRNAIRKTFLCTVALLITLVIMSACVVSAASRNGWNKQKTQYFKNGKAVSGLVTINSAKYYFDPVTKRKATEQFVRIKGKQYYFAPDGTMVFGKQEVNNYICIFNNKTGALISRKKDRRPIYTGAGWYDILIGEMVKKAGLKSGMSDEKIVKKAYLYLTKNFMYTKDLTKKTKIRQYHKAPSDTRIKSMEQKVKELQAAGSIRVDDSYCSRFQVLDLSGDGNTGAAGYVMNNYWLYHLGVCDDFSAIFTMMCNRMGVKAGKCGGLAYGYSHAWSWAYVDGEKYYFDPGNSIHMYRDNGKKVSYSLYMMTKTDLAKHHKIQEEW